VAFGKIHNHLLIQSNKNSNYELIIRYVRISKLTLNLWLLATGWTAVGSEFESR
jgi:hypothetical protein